MKRRATRHAEPTTAIERGHKIAEDNFHQAELTNYKDRQGAFDSYLKNAREMAIDADGGTKGPVFAAMMDRWNALESRKVR